MTSAAVLFVKNEYQDITWWISWYLSIGFDHVYVFDDGSDDNTDAVVKILSESLPVSLEKTVDGPLFNLRQKNTYIHAIEMLKGKYDWAGFFDADEYLVFSEDVQINEFLSRFPDAGAIGINWCCYGSNFHVQKPDTANVFDAYTNYSNPDFRENHIVKSLVNLHKTDAAYINPHHFQVHGNYYRPDGSILEWDDEFDDRTKHTPDWSIAKVRHHIHRSVEHYVEKVRKRSDLREMRLGVELFVYHDTNDNTDFLTEYQSRNYIYWAYKVQSALRNYFYNKNSQNLSLPWGIDTDISFFKVKTSHNATELMLSDTGVIKHEPADTVSSGQNLIGAFLDKENGRAILLNENFRPIFISGESHCTTVYPVIVEQVSDAVFTMRSTLNEKYLSFLPDGNMEGGRLRADTWEHAQLEPVTAPYTVLMAAFTSMLSSFGQGHFTVRNPFLKQDIASDLLVSLICLSGVDFINNTLQQKDVHYLPWLMGSKILRS